VKNPFSDFRSLPYTKRELPLEGIVKAKEEVMERIVDGYRHLVEEEIKDLVWLVEHSRVARAYSAALKSLQDLSYDQDDIEDFCADIDNSDKIPYIISGPAGIYVSALINNAKEDRMVLRLEDYEQTYHFLGYRLPEGKTLVLQGNVGDFTGASLSGGHLVVEGSTGNWCGAGMTRGEILVTGFTGLNTGEQMRGGEIHVDGRIRSVGRTIFGGRIYQRGQLIAP
jgi:hypothetical protein